MEVLNVTRGGSKDTVLQFTKIKET